MLHFFHTYVDIFIALFFIDAILLSVTVTVIVDLEERHPVTKFLITLTSTCFTVTLVYLLPIGMTLGVMVILLHLLAYSCYNFVKRIKLFLREKFVNPDY